MGYSKRSYFCVARVRVFVAGPMTALSDDRAVGTIGDDFGNPFVRERGGPNIRIRQNLGTIFSGAGPFGRFRSLGVGFDFGFGGTVGRMK